MPIKMRNRFGEDEKEIIRSILNYDSYSKMIEKSKESKDALELLRNRLLKSNLPKKNKEFSKLINSNTENITQNSKNYRDFLKKGIINTLFNTLNVAAFDKLMNEYNKVPKVAKKKVRFVEPEEDKIESEDETESKDDTESEVYIYKSNYNKEVSALEQFYETLEIFLQSIKDTKCGRSITPKIQKLDFSDNKKLKENKSKITNMINDCGEISDFQEIKDFFKENYDTELPEEVTTYEDLFTFIKKEGLGAFDPKFGRRPSRPSKRRRSRYRGSRHRGSRHRGSRRSRRT